ncbi:MAG: MurR/RpiR family transcriptional regulator [Calditrichia bacterium]
MLDIESLPKRRKKVVKFLSDNPDDVAFLTVREIASKLNVNPSTVVRACKDLGFEGFEALRKHRKEVYQKRLTGYDDMLLRLQFNSPLEEIITSSLRTDVEILNRTISEVHWEKIVETVKKISKSDHTYIIGLEGARHIASYLATELRTYLANVIEVTRGNGYLFDFIRHFKKGDLVFGISFGRCIRQTVIAMKTAHEMGLTTISITDSQLSPLFKYSQISLLTSSVSDSYFSSFVSAMSLSNAIIKCCAELEREKSLRELKKLKEQWEEAKIYYDE